MHYFSALLTNVARRRRFLCGRSLMTRTEPTKRATNGPPQVRRPERAYWTIAKGLLFLFRPIVQNHFSGCVNFVPCIPVLYQSRAIGIS